MKGETAQQRSIRERETFETKQLRKEYTTMTTATTKIIHEKENSALYLSKN